MIYHFCNSAFGHTFRLLAAAFSRDYGVPITTVMTRSPGRDNNVGLPIVVTDVNAPAFLALITQGAQGIVTGFNQIFSQRAIDTFSSIVNIHTSVLPYYRGPTPAYWCIEYGERMTGYTLHEVTAAIDSGPILYQEVVPMEDVREPAVLTRRLAVAAGPTFVRYLHHLRTGSHWEKKLVDAATVYTTFVGYRSFPPRGG